MVGERIMGQLMIMVFWGRIGGSWCLAKGGAVVSVLFTAPFRPPVLSKYSFIKWFFKPSLDSLSFLMIPASAEP